MNTVILALGNELLGDEGVGIHAYGLLQQKQIPMNTTLVEVGTAILDALPELEHADRIIVLDAMKGGEPPGTVYKTLFKHCSGAPSIASMHGFDIFRTMALAQRTTSPHVVVFGVEPEQICWSMDLSETVTKSLPIFLMQYLLSLMILTTEDTVYNNKISGLTIH